MMRVSRRVNLGFRLCLGLAMVTPSVLLVTSGPSNAESSFTARAEAQAFHVTISNDKGTIPVVPQIDAGIGSASAMFTSFGGGTARAATPDAGSAASLPTLAGAVVPSLIPFPLPFAFPPLSAPGDISVQAGQDPASFGAGPYKLAAEVTDSQSSATASLGGEIDDDSGALRALSTAKVTAREDGSVLATAKSSYEGLRVNGLVTIGRVVSTASASRDSSGAITRESDLNIAALDLAGLSIVFKDGQFVTAAGKVPVQLNDVIKLLSKLTAGALDLEVVSAKKTPNGIIGGSLRLTQTVPAPPQCVAIPLPTPVISGVTYCGVTTVVYDFGKAVAVADLTPIPDASAPPAAGGAAGGGGVSSPDLGSGPIAGPLPGVDPPLAAAPGAPAQSPTVIDPVAGNPLLGVNARFVDMSNLYLALVGLAGLLLISSTCIRMLGVRNKWTS